LISNIVDAVTGGVPPALDPAATKPAVAVEHHHRTIRTIHARMILAIDA
jgi:hypothetical protein